MTIITGSNLVQPQKDNLPSPPEVVEDYVFLMENEKNEDKKIVEPLEFKKNQAVIVNVAPARVFLPLALRQRHQRVWLMMFVIFILVGLILACMCLYKKMLHEKQVRQFTCGVRFHELPPTTTRLISDGDSAFLKSDLSRGVKFTKYTTRPRDGEFRQEVEIDEYFEKIFVPTIGDTRRATILHDFNVNYTAIIDKEQGHCFLLPLNRSLVIPPKDFWDLLVKLRSGYYVPDATVVREDYRVLTPAIQDLTEFGVYITGECSYFDSYRLVRDGQPIAMAKRSACEFMGDSYCLGDAGSDQMLCLNIQGCI